TSSTCIVSKSGGGSALSAYPEARGSSTCSMYAAKSQLRCRRDAALWCGDRRDNGRRVRVVRWQTIWQCIIAPGVPRRSLAAAVVVGTLLNLINQGDALFSGRRLDWLKVVLTYIVPYCVATYGAVAFRLEAMRRETRPRN